MSKKISDLEIYTISITEKGCILQNPKKSPGNKGKKNIKPRGKITTFSKASRRRLRKTMMDKFPVYPKICTVTFTLPIDMNPEEETDFWRRFQSDYLSKNDIAIIWRREITGKGRSHWHCICAYPDWYRPVLLASEWVNRLQQVFDYLPSGTGDHAVKIEYPMDKSIAWLRYMMDHSSKRKSYQVLKDGGRHWGVIGRKNFVETNFEKRETNEKAYFCVVRFLRRLLAYRRDGKIYRRKNRANFGRSDWFLSDSQIRALKIYVDNITGER